MGEGSIFIIENISLIVHSVHGMWTNSALYIYIYIYIYINIYIHIYACKCMVVF